MAFAAERSVWKTAGWWNFRKSTRIADGIREPLTSAERNFQRRQPDTAGKGRRYGIMERILQKLDGIWEYRGLDETEPNAAFEEIRLPHTVRVLPYNCFDERSYQTRGIYRKRLYLPSEWAGRRLRLRFEGVMAETAVFLNGSRVGGHRGGYTPFEVDITGQARIGGEKPADRGGRFPGTARDSAFRRSTGLSDLRRNLPGGLSSGNRPGVHRNAQVQSQNLLTDAPSLPRSGLSPKSRRQ